MAKTLTYNGETKTMLEWSKSTGIALSTLYGRLRFGWSVDEILGFAEHKTRVKCRWITYRGETNNLSEWSRSTGIDFKTIHYRLKRGWSVGEALGFEERKRGELIRYGGRALTAVEWSKETGIDEATIRNRFFRLGWTSAETLGFEQPKDRTKHRMLSYNGETKTLTQWSIETGVSKDRIRGRVRSGWSVGQALEFDERT